MRRRTKGAEGAKRAEGAGGSTPRPSREGVTSPSRHSISSPVLQPQRQTLRLSLSPLTVPLFSLYRSTPTVTFHVSPNTSAPSAPLAPSAPSTPLALQLLNLCCFMDSFLRLWAYGSWFREQDYAEERRRGPAILFSRTGGMCG